MRSKSGDLMNSIIEFIDSKYSEHNKIPTIREIADGLGISKSCVSSYLNEMTEKGLIENSGGHRGIRTTNMTKAYANLNAIPIVGPHEIAPTIGIAFKLA